MVIACEKIPLFLGIYCCANDMHKPAFDDYIFSEPLIFVS